MLRLQQTDKDRLRLRREN